MTRDEAAALVAWAAAEGWNPGNADIGIAWAADPGAFIALRQGEELIGGGAIFSHGGSFGFMGLFIMRPEWRGAGLGARLWHERLRRLRARLQPGATIGMDGVFDMVPFYEKGGFAFAHRDLRFQGVADGSADPAVRPLEDAHFTALERFDRAHFPAPRAAFLRQWVFQPGGHALALFEHGEMAGYGVLRPAREGYKIGPLFARTEHQAERLLSSLLAQIPGQAVQLDVPEPNAAGLHLAAKFGLAEVFGCARLYHGPTPDLPLQQIFGVTSFEFG
jgi:GNAT superfamily N-acetyltransferase